MPAVFSPRLDILPVAQRRLWQSLAPTSVLGFVLYGGTAIALRLGHRPSVDFDFFTEHPLEKDALRANFPFVAGATVLQDQPETFTVLLSSNEVDAPNVSTERDEVKVSFFGGLNFGRIGEPGVALPGDIQVASLVDLLAHKLKVVLQRIEAKDYLDIATLITARVPLAMGLAGARTLFGASFQPSECLKALVYFEGGDLETLSDQTRETLIDAVRAVGNLPPVPRLSNSLTDENQ